MNEEGPILNTVLARRIGRAHGWVRTGARIRDRGGSGGSRAFQIPPGGAWYLLLADPFAVRLNSISPSW
ncbi:DUF3320 domain-containing protein [Pseudomonas cucumis]|uniref:DUF3320 domain-containing protein n=1 Tax=Pseudomonas cucumis TaxID=2954082 RepID=UPI002736317B|nr:DUF3320 domain-containing protein [Pseudomonas cucumis]WLG92535.1 DUF3320 domain-containing protein [Pseudomonas cucumis]